MLVGSEVHLTALPPWAQEEREREAIRAVVSSSEMQRIDDDEGRHYLVTLPTGEIIRVNVRYVASPPGILGPQVFELLLERSLGPSGPS